MRIVRIALIALCALAAGPLSGLGVPTAPPIIPAVAPSDELHLARRENRRLRRD